MTLRAKILVDECLSRPALETLRPFLDLSGDCSEVAHQFDVYGEGTEDPIWVPQAAKDGWTVFTSDRGKHSKVEAKLPLLCEAYGVTHFLIASGLNKRRMAFKVLKLEEHWAEIAAYATDERKARYSLHLAGETTTRLKFVKYLADDFPKHRQIDLIP